MYLFLRVSFFVLLLWSSLCCAATVLINNNAVIETKQWPRIVFQTHNHKYIPRKVHANFDKYARGWERRIYNDTDAVLFLEKNFVPEVATAFQSLALGAHKADLLRYALLYAFGGLYVDLDTELVVPLNYVAQLANNSLFLCHGAVGPSTVAHQPLLLRAYTGVIGGPPGSPIFLKMVEFMTRTPATHYFYNIDELTRLMKVHNVGGAKNTLPSGFASLMDGSRVFIALEEYRSTVECWDGADRYGVCTFITYKGEKLFKNRYADFHKWGDHL